ncbi:MAG: IS3 family transposase [Lactococcus sp.]|nr:IS3 family transposase [Lactococcus sp.]MDN6525294.1 IS3 family transposase [Lactococcus sp.]
MTKIKRYDEEFKQSLVNLYQTGKTQSELIKDYGISASALGKWIKQYSEVKLEDNSVLTARQIQELMKRNAQLEEENLIPKKSKCHIHAKLKIRLSAVHRLRFEHAIQTLCRVLHVNRSTYYKALKKTKSKREIDNMTYRKLFLDIHIKSKKRFGTRSFKRVLLRDYGINISEGRIYRLLKTMSLPKMSTIKPRWKHEKSSQHPKTSNHLKQQFNHKAPNLVWTTDFTYISIGHKKHVYLCVILDLFSRKVIAWKLSHKIDAQLAIDTLELAIKNRKPTESLLFHSDQGSQFKAKSFRKALDDNHMLASYSAPGYPYDNSVTEVFFKYFKLREANRRQFHNIQEVKLSCFEYIEGFYNNYNPHSANNFLTPNEKDKRYLQNKSH